MDLNGLQIPILRVDYSDIDAPFLIQRLGGTIKIGKEIAANLTPEELIGAMTQEADNVEGKINFGMSVYDSNNREPRNTKHNEIEGWAKQIKNNLKEKGRSVRYISSSDGILNSATVFHNHLDSKGREFLVTPHAVGAGSPRPERWLLAATKAVQPIEELSKRDFGRPGRDDVSGMLPPKLAMMMINLAVGNWKLEIGNFTLMDPFCGSGTILTEAVRLGYKNIIGTDVSEKAITDTKRNVDWTINSIDLKSKIENLKLNVFQADVFSLASKLSPHTINAIVTEPYMGPPLRGKESPEQIKKTCAELADLYTKAFEQFAKILKPDGSVVFIIPRYELRDMRYTISDRIIPRLKEFGFTKERLLPESATPTSYILYQRPGQYVGREIWKFGYKKTGS